MRVRVGGVNLMQKMEEQERLLGESAKQLEEQARSEEQLRRRIEERDFEAKDLDQKYSSLQEENQGALPCSATISTNISIRTTPVHHPVLCPGVRHRADKTRKLKKLFTLLEQAKDEVHAEREEAEREKEQLLDTIRDLSRDLKRALLLLDAYIPKARPPRTAPHHPAPAHVYMYTVHVLPYILLIQARCLPYRCFVTSTPFAPAPRFRFPFLTSCHNSISVHTSIIHL